MYYKLITLEIVLMNTPFEKPIVINVFVTK